MKRGLCFALTMILHAEVPRGLDTLIPTPDHNPLTPARIEQGRALFFDKRLSKDNSLSCATCHQPERAFTDQHATAVGIAGQKGPRRTPTLLNRAYGQSFFWDGRAATLEEQVLQPIFNPIEMGLTIPEIEQRTGLSTKQVALALASYVRTIFSGDSPYDRYLNGDQTALSPDAREGLRLFQGKANCTSCHLGPNLTDEQFHNTGLAWNGTSLTDKGRENKGLFKTPTLRDIARRPPYMHDGSLPTLEALIDYYNQGGRPNPHLDAEIKPLRLTAIEKRQLFAFLQALSGRVQEGHLP
jgi:cytochrome c peroxidase